MSIEVEVVEANPTTVTVVEVGGGETVVLDVTPTHEVVLTDVGAQGPAGHSIAWSIHNEEPTEQDPGETGDLWIVTG